jgi:aldose 1-epimerase
MTSKEQIEKRSFGTAPNGAPADLYILAAGRGFEAHITNYGGILASLMVPDRDGKLRDVALGHADAGAYGTNRPYLGALIGRYGNRIAGGRFELDGQVHQLAKNNGANHLHGGPGGFHGAIWQAKPVADPDGPALELRYRSADGDEGYPGNLDVTVVYTLARSGELRIRYRATTDRATPVNLTHHGYFNLGDTPDILDHWVKLNATRFLPIDSGLIPSGELRDVAGTPFDFRSPSKLRDHVDAAHLQLGIARGIDPCYVIDRGKREKLAIAAEVYDRASGRAMQVRTTEPAFQFYTGNFLDGTVVGKEGRAYGPRAGFCIETEHYPDSPNQPAFPSTILRPGEEYRQTTVYAFTAL